MAPLVVPKFSSCTKTGRTDVDAVAGFAERVRALDAHTMCEVASTRIARVLISWFINYDPVVIQGDDEEINATQYALIMSSGRRGFRCVIVISTGVGGINRCSTNT